VNGLTIFGLAAVTAMLGSIYGFLQGAWPFGLVEGIWSLVALRRWSRTRSRLPAALERQRE